MITILFNNHNILIHIHIILFIFILILIELYYKLQICMLRFPLSILIYWRRFYANMLCHVTLSILFQFDTCHSILFTYNNPKLHDLYTNNLSGWLYHVTSYILQQKIINDNRIKNNYFNKKNDSYFLQNS